MRDADFLFIVAELANALASTNMLLREDEKAESLFDRTIELAPEIGDNHSHKARTALFGEGNLEKTLAILDEALRVVSDTGNRHLKLTSIQTAIWAGQREKALREIAALATDAIEEQQHFVPVASLRGQVRGLRADFEDARKVVDARLAKNPLDANLLSALGIALAGLGRKEEAIRKGRRAVELMPTEKEAWDGMLRRTDLACIYAMVGEHDLAIDLIEKLLENPGEMGAASLAVDPRWIPLRKNSRFKALQNR